MKADARTRHALRRWIVARNGLVAATELFDDTPLIERRILTSLDVLDLILFLEELRGGERIDVERLQVGSFRDVDAILRTFFDGTA